MDELDTIFVGTFHEAVASVTYAPTRELATKGRTKKVPYVLKSNPHPFYSFRGLKNQMRIRFAVESWILEK